MEREAEILRQLMAAAGGSRKQRNRAIDSLLRQGYTEEEITDALRAEALRLRAEAEALTAVLKAAGR